MKKNMRLIKTAAMSLGLALVLNVVSYGQNTAPISLNGQSFKLDLVDAQNNVTHDVINFKETSFTCNAIANSTYTATRYTVEPQADGKLFLYAIAISETDGNITWKGHLVNGVLEGGMLVEKTGVPVEKHTFAGKPHVNTNESE